MIMRLNTSNHEGWNPNHQDVLITRGRKIRWVFRFFTKACLLPSCPTATITMPAITSLPNGSLRFLWFLGIAFVCLVYILTYLPETTPPPDGKTLDDRTCVEGGWKFALVFTHCLTFILIPIAMKVFYDALPKLCLPPSSVFAAQLGLAFVMVSIASEIGWHVTQCWYYTNHYTMLNFMFYFFLISGFALWSDCFVTDDTLWTKLIDLMYAVLLLLMCLLYPLGYTHENDNYKIPIYIALTVTLGVLTHRGWKVIDNRWIILFPILSIVVNLYFIAKLNKVVNIPNGGQYGTVPLAALNAKLHVSHDLFGTLAGVAVFTLLVYLKGKSVQSISGSQYV